MMVSLLIPALSCAGEERIEYPPVVLQISSSVEGYPTLIGQASSEALRRSYLLENNITADLGWMEIFHRQVEMLRLRLANRMELSLDTTWEILIKKDPQGVQGVIVAANLPPLQEWRGLDLRVLDYTTSVFLLNEPGLVGEEEIEALAAAKMRRISASLAGLSPDTSWEALFLETFKKRLPEARTTETLEASVMYDPIIQEYYRWMKGGGRDWKTLLLEDVEEARRTVAEYLTTDAVPDPDTSWAGLLKEDRNFTIMIVTEQFDLPDPSTGWVFSASDAELTVYAAERERRWKTFQLKLAPDVSWTEIFIMDMLHGKFTPPSSAPIPVS